MSVGVSEESYVPVVAKGIAHADYLLQKSEQKQNITQNDTGLANKLYAQTAVLELMDLAERKKIPISSITNFTDEAYFIKLRF